MKITPIFDNVVVRAEDAEEVRASGIVIPDTVSKDRPQQGSVLSVGPDCKAVKKGDTVLFKTYSPSPTEITIEGTEYLLMKEEDILGTL